jgi:hypothetical protein
MKFTTILLAIFIIVVQMLAVSGKKNRKHRAHSKASAKNKIKATKNKNTACVGGKCGP